MTVVGIECDSATFNVISKVHTRNCSFKEKSFFSNFCFQMANWIIVDIVKYFY